jgi:hypothetical protein
VAAGFDESRSWRADQISSIVDLYKYGESNDCCRALVGAWSYVHIQNVSSAVWTVHHGLKTDDLAVFGYNAFMLGHDMNDWSAVNVIDNNTIQVVWPEPRTGRVVVISTGTRPNPNLELFLQYIDAYPNFYTEKTFDADDYMTVKTHWDAATKTVKLFTIYYAYTDGYMTTKRIVHEVNSQYLLLTYTYNAAGDNTTISRTIGMVT